MAKLKMIPDPAWRRTYRKWQLDEWVELVHFALWHLKSGWLFSGFMVGFAFILYLLIARDWTGEEVIQWVLHAKHTSLLTPHISTGANIEITQDAVGASRLLVNIAPEQEGTKANAVSFQASKPLDVADHPHPVLHIQNLSKHEVIMRLEMWSHGGDSREALTNVETQKQPYLLLPAETTVRWSAPSNYPYLATKPVDELVLIFYGPQGTADIRILGIGFTGKSHGLVAPQLVSVPPPSAHPPNGLRAAFSIELDSAPHVTWEQLEAERRELLEDLERRTIQWFLYHAQRHPFGVVPDRAPPRAAADILPRHKTISVAGVGFQLAVLVVAEQRGLLPKGEAAARAEPILEFLLDNIPRKKGLFAHFDVLSEHSSIDHSLLLAGAFCLGAWAPESKAAGMIPQLAEVAWSDLIIQRGDRQLISMGIAPDSDELLPAAWDAYNEGLLVYCLAAAREPQLGELFKQLAQSRFPAPEGQAFPGQSLPLFVHQYPQLFLGTSVRLPGGLDLCQNSRRATLYNKLVSGREAVPTFDSPFWGVTAGDTPPRGPYHAFAPVKGGSRGVCCPGGALGSASFCLGVVAQDVTRWKAFRDGQVWDAIVGDLGFADTFRLSKDGDVTVAEDSIAITQGAAVLALAEARDHGISRLFRSVPEVQRGMRACGMSWNPDPGPKTTSQ